MDAIALLTRDHRIVEQVLRDYDAACSDRQRRGVVETTTETGRPAYEPVIHELPSIRREPKIASM
jgi:hypothetical protein